MVGRLVDVGGYRLHLNCSGSGGLTVVFDSGALDSSRQWDLVQPQIAKTTLSCSFDRAGLGWSDRSATRPSFAENARELHGLLRKAGIPPPYILVGHSNGGLDMQTFAYEYPDDVIGMVLDDSVHADETIRFRTRFATPVWEKAVLRIGVRLGVARLFGWCDQSGACPDCVKFTDTLMDQFTTYPQSEAEVQSSASFGSIPLFVLEHDPKVGLVGERDEAFEQAWIGWQRNLAMRSSNSKLEVVTGAGHEIQTDQPQRVVDAIGWVMKQLDQSATGEEVRSAERSQAGSH
jgi:pimeloyl-ACP methyl ester carboxylesterase